jgi:hypothetical protein
MNRVRTIISFLLIVLVLSGCSSHKLSVITDGSPEEMRSNAMTLYEEGDTSSATYQMTLYLQDNPTDMDAIRLLAEWYTELGQTAYAKKYIQMLGESTEVELDADIILSGLVDSSLITVPVSGARIEIAPLAIQSADVVMTVTGKNLFSGQYESNSYLGSDASGWRTSDWFFVDSSCGALTISGGFNRAVWQFELRNGERILAGDDSLTYRVSNSNLVKNQAIATTEIPEDAVRCRIAYAFEPDTETDTLEERIQIEYGEFPSDYEPYESTQISIPDMVEGSSVTYENGTWRLVGKGSESILDVGDILLDKGDTVSISSTLAPLVTLDLEEASVNTTGVYGVTWSNDSTSILLERTDDAVGLSFNYLSGEDWAGPYQNDFDNIYPWSDIRLCAIDDSGNITYEGEAGFTTDGSAGNVFVEIPKHYVKREVVDGQEYIAISATQREGFQIDPSFSREGGEVEKIYVAAYLTSLSSGKASSVSGEIPAIDSSLLELREYMSELSESNVGIYQEIDFFAVMTIQRLFLIETAVRNTQVFWQGQTSKAYFSLNAPQQYALYDAEKTNSITIEDSKLNQRFQVGDAVCISTYEQFFGGRKYDNYYSRKITEIQSTGNELCIYFDGDPLNVISGTTQIAHVSDINGKMDELSYHSGSSGKNDGLSSFRYRWIENLWGNGFIHVEGVEITNRTITVTYPNGLVSTMNFELGIQQMSPGQTGVDYGVMNISSFGFDENNPLVMLPDTAGASSSTSFGDALYTGFADGWEEHNVHVLWGGTWDLRTSCGLFCYRFLARDMDNFRENASRMMYCSFEE